MDVQGYCRKQNWRLKMLNTTGFFFLSSVCNGFLQCFFVMKRVTLPYTIYMFDLTFQCLTYLKITTIRINFGCCFVLGFFFFFILIKCTETRGTIIKIIMNKMLQISLLINSNYMPSVNAETQLTTN